MLAIDDPLIPAAGSVVDAPAVAQSAEISIPQAATTVAGTSPAQGKGSPPTAVIDQAVVVDRSKMPIPPPSWKLAATCSVAAGDGRKLAVAQ
jgi:hypothetical protein